MKYLIVGLGNIGEEYKNTRHNIGFNIVDAFALLNNGLFTDNRYASTCTVKMKGRSFILIKPNTYMNLSGKAINYWLQKENIPIEHLMVIVDDIALPLGTIRIRAKGSDAGHNGLKNIQDILGHSNYCRLRFGIGNDYPKGAQVDFVLGEWTKEETQILPERIKIANDAITSFGLCGTQFTMNNFNNK
jgi:peptidyl-tRNA hydrolase, PTH1 family